MHKSGKKSYPAKKGHPGKKSMPMTPAEMKKAHKKMGMMK